MADYSSKTLVEKLGLKPGMKAIAVGAPASYKNETGLQNSSLSEGKFEFIHVFYAQKSDLLRDIPLLFASVSKNGMLWVSWPKKASQMPTDITEQTLRDVLLPTGLVDIKVAAIDETWSGLKFVRRRNP